MIGYMSPLLGIYSEEGKSMPHTDICTLLFMALFPITNMWEKSSYPSINEQMCVMGY